MKTTIISLEGVSVSQVLKLTEVLCNRQTFCGHAVGLGEENDHIIFDGQINSLEITYTGENVDGDDVYCVVIMPGVE